MNTFFKNVVDHFKKQNIRYYVSGNQSSLLSIYNHGGCTVNLKFMSFSENGFVIMADGQRTVPKDRLAEGLRYAAEINFKRVMGTLEIDPDDGQWRYRLSLTLFGQKKAPAELLAWGITNCLTEFLLHTKVLDLGNIDPSLGEDEEDLLDLLEEEATPHGTEDADEEEWVIQDEELRRILGED